LKNLTLRSLRAFEAAASTGSFTRAAELLDASQSAVSQLIRQLDQEVGTATFDTPGTSGGAHRRGPRTAAPWARDPRAAVPRRGDLDAPKRSFAGALRIRL
jgi:hypothetical protein